MITLPSGTRPNEVLTISSGGVSRTVLLTPAVIASGSVREVYPLPDYDGILEIDASVAGGNVGTIRVQRESAFRADLDPRTDDGASNTDAETSIMTPEFTFTSVNIMEAGDSARLVDAQGNVVGTTVVTAGDVDRGLLNVPTHPLDDGTYTFLAQIVDPLGAIRASQPVNVTVITDRDGVMPSVELVANGGDFNGDGKADWQQNNVAQLPLSSLEAYAAGKAAPATSFGVIIAGNVASGNSGAPALLNMDAQLLDVGLAATPAPLPSNTVAATPMMAFTVTNMTGHVLQDLDPNREGLQVRVVIDLPTGVTANTFLKFNAQTQNWYSFDDDQRLDTLDDGATRLDLNGDGKVDRLVVTLTDGALGDADGIANGIVVDPGMLVMRSNGVYSVLLENGDRYYTTSATEAARYAAGNNNLFEGVRFDSLAPELGGERMYANFQPFTDDWYFGDAADLGPYLCYERDGVASGFFAAGAGQGGLTQFHLYMNAAGATQLVSQAEAALLGLAAKGFADHGAQFGSTTAGAFVFDAEAYLIANKDAAGMRAFVQTLATSYQRSSDAGFVDAVEQHYLGQAVLVGQPHGDSATSAELNAVFGTQFVA